MKKIFCVTVSSLFLLALSLTSCEDEKLLESSLLVNEINHYIARLMKTVCKLMKKIIPMNQVMKMFSSWKVEQERYTQMVLWKKLLPGRLVETF